MAAYPRAASWLPSRPLLLSSHWRRMNVRRSRFDRWAFDDGSWSCSDGHESIFRRGCVVRSQLKSVAPVRFGKTAAQRRPAPTGSALGRRRQFAESSHWLVACRLPELAANTCSKSEAGLASPCRAQNASGLERPTTLSPNCHDGHPPPCFRPTDLSFF